MHLPQIAALPKLANGSAEPDRPAQSASGADGFQAVFAGDTPPRRSAAEPVADDAVNPGSRAGAKKAAPGKDALVKTAPGGDVALSGARSGGGQPLAPDVRPAQGQGVAETGTQAFETRSAESPSEDNGPDKAGPEETRVPELQTAEAKAGEMGVGDRVPDMGLAAVSVEPARTLPAVAAGATTAPGNDAGADMHAAEAIAGTTGRTEAGAIPLPGAAATDAGAAGTRLEAGSQARNPSRVTAPGAPDAPAGPGPIAMDAGAKGGPIPATATALAQAGSVAGGNDPAHPETATGGDAASAAARPGDVRVDPRLAGTGPGAGHAALAPGAANGGSMPVDPSRPGKDPGISTGRDLRPADPATTARHDGAAPAGPGGPGAATSAGQSLSTAAGLHVQAGAETGADTPRSRRADAQAAAAEPTAASGSQTRAVAPAQHLAAAAGRTDSGTETRAASARGGFGAAGAGDGLFSGEAPVPDVLPVETRGVSRSAAPDGLPVLQSPQTPRSVSLQIAEVVRASGERAVELRLQPEELGRVQMTLSQDAAGSLTVALTVERAETLDLLRRNIDLLGADLRELGYENVDFSFQGGSQGNGAGDGKSERSPAETTHAAGTGPTRPAAPTMIGSAADRAGSGIDIRL